MRRRRAKARKIITFEEARRFDWLKAISSEDGPPCPTTRLVLFALSLHMNENGGSCYPSLSRLSKDTALSLRTVKAHAKRAFEEGWLVRMRKQGYASNYSRYEYQAVIPEYQPCRDGATDAPSQGDDGANYVRDGEPVAH